MKLRPRAVIYLSKVPHLPVEGASCYDRNVQGEGLNTGVLDWVPSPVWHSKNSFFPPLMNMLFLLIYSCRSFVFLYRSFIVQLVKNPPVMQETPVQFLGWEDPLEKG